MNDDEPKSRPARRGAEAAARAAQMLREGGRRAPDEAARLLLQAFANPLRRWFMTFGRVPESEAEELSADVIFKFVTKPPPDTCPPDVWLWTIAHHDLVSWARKRNSEKSGGAGSAKGRPRAEIALDDEAMLELFETTAAAGIPPWVRLCVHRAAYEMQQQDPRHAQVLAMFAQGLSAEDIALVFRGTPGPVSDKEKAAARDRVYRAVQAARSFFEHCKE